MIRLQRYADSFEDEYYRMVAARVDGRTIQHVLRKSEAFLPPDFYMPGNDKFETLILASYRKMKEAVSYMEKNDFPSFSESEEVFFDVYRQKFAGIMRSQKGGETMSVRIVRASGLRICPYCNRDFINSRGPKVAGAQMDHFYSKTRYPVFALSLYNLVPSCGTCNLVKSDSDEAIISPFDPDFDFNGKIKFSYNSETNTVEVKGDVKNIELFRLREAYKIHSDEAAELFEKKQAYNSSQLKEIQELLQKEGRFLPMEKLREDVFGKCTDTSEFGKRPLAKFYHDILEQ